MDSLLIFIRRFFALLLIPLFFVLFLGTLLTFRVNGTLLEASYYTDTLTDLDAYNFLYDTGIPEAVEEAQARSDRGETGFDINEDVPLNLGLTPESVSLNIKEVLPPDWLERNVTAVINAGVPYITGETDSFDITIAVDDRVEAATEVAKRLILGADIHAFLLDDVVEPELDKNAQVLAEDLPYGLVLTNAQILDGIRTVVPEDWLKDRIAEVIDEVTPYFTGKSDTFAIVIPLQDRADVGLEVVEDWLLTSLDGGAYDYLLEEQIAPVVVSNLGAAVQLPFGVTVTDEEVVEAIGKVLPQSWVEERVSEAIVTVGPYLAAQRDSFTLVLPLGDRLDAAAATLVDTADAKFESLLTSLRTCTVAEALELELSLDELPPCRPPGVSYNLLKRIVGLDVLDELVENVFVPLPRRIQLTQDDLFRAIGSDSTVQVEDVRDVLRDGFTFDERDLITLIENEADTTDDAEKVVEILDDIRRYMRDGFSFDQSDVEEQFDNQSDFNTFDDIRTYIGTGRDFLFLLIVLLGAIALFIGLLGGRRWGTRLIWAGVPVLIAGAATAAVLGPIAGSSSGFEVLDELIQDLEVNDVFVAKLLELREELEQTFVSPMAFQSALVGALGAAMIVLGAFASRRRRHVVTAIPTTAGTWETDAARTAREVVSELRAEVDELQTEVGELQAERDEAEADANGEEGKGEGGDEKPRSDA